MFTETSITITVNGTTVRGTLQDSAATVSLLAQLPLELSFEDYGGQEKIATLPAPLAMDGMPPGGSAEPGTIGYYVPDQALVLYYDTVGYYNGIIPLGRFDDVATVRDAPAFTGTMTAT
ncbi:cyclophilin-like fold protein [Microbacterium sp. DT81.1]|uniref:cyclophilin-like fold protein n=1 Tax=Microbacterium sp. DT81.1 TaxID=3393413 RepID=UPI003CE92F4A